MWGLVGAALAAEPWDVVGVQRVPRTAGVQLAQSLVGGPTTQWFGDLVVGATIGQGAGGRNMGVGLDLGFGALAVVVPDEDRAALLGRPAGCSLTAWFAGPRPATLHGVAFRIAFPTSGSTTYLWSVDDAGLPFGVDYVGNFDAEVVDLRVGLGVGGGTLTLVSAHASLATTVDLTDRVALVVATQAGVGPLWGRLGARWRPTPSLELGADASVALADPTAWARRPEGAWPVVPTLTVRGFAPAPPTFGRNAWAIVAP